MQGLSRSVCRVFRVFVLFGLLGSLGEMVGAVTITNAPCDEEFSGPFASWRNVQTYYGATGNGVTDDTTAIQNALNDLRTARNNGWSVLYFPAGTYLISQELITTRQDPNNDYFGSSIIGADPATTSIKWNGASGGTMFSHDGYYCAIRRLTFNGNSGLAGTGLLRGNNFSTYSEISDCDFLNMASRHPVRRKQRRGIAEDLIKRCHFTNCSTGIQTWDWNSMDEWIWYCLFQNCGEGVFNEMGNYHVYNSVFLNNTVADMGSNNSMVFSIVGNTSIGSQCFMNQNTDDQNIDCGGFVGSPVYIRGNQIYDPVETRCIRTQGRRPDGARQYHGQPVGGEWSGGRLGRRQ